MAVPLAEALEQVDLDAGSTYCCRVKGRWIEVRVLAAEPPGLAKPLTSSDVRLDPWIELPGATSLHRCRVRRGFDLTFDIPNVPTE